MVDFKRLNEERKRRMASKQKQPGTAVANWDKQLAEAADRAAAQEANVAGGQFFSVKSGVLTFNDAPLPGNQMAVVILDGILENVYYEGEFDPQNPANPTCFALGRDEAAMAPHETVVAAEQAQHETCAGCPRNEWGSADRGKGKACRNTRRLGMISAGTLDERTGEFSAEEDPEHFKSAQVGFMRLPVTSIKGYAAFVKQVAGALRRPPHGIFAKVRVLPDAKTQFRVTFEALGLIPDPIMGVVMTRHEEVAATIEFPHQIGERERATPPPKGKIPARPGSRAKY